jgi:hypothetical protein
VLAQEKEISLKVIKVPRIQKRSRQREGDPGDDSAHTHKNERKEKKSHHGHSFFVLYATVAADRIHRVGSKIRDEENRHTQKRRKKETLHSSSSDSPAVSALVSQ